MLVLHSVAVALFMFILACYTVIALIPADQRVNTLINKLTYPLDAAGFISESILAWIFIDMC